MLETGLGGAASWPCCCALSLCSKGLDALTACGLASVTGPGALPAGPVGRGSWRSGPGAARIKNTMAVAAVAVTHPPITMVLRFTTHAFRKFLVTGTVLVSLAAPALAIDAYDGATGQLTIPVVRAYGNLYRDVVVEIGEVVSVVDSF